MKDARRAAAAALMKQEQNGYSNLVLRHTLDEFDGSARDRAFVSAVFYGTVERMITLDYILGKFLSKPLAKLDAAVRAILRSGLYQARYMENVPVRAAISESVTLTRQMGKTSAAGLVNAVLRRASEFDLESECFSCEAERLSVRFSVSKAIAKLLLEKCPNQCESVLAQSFHEPQLCLRVNSLCADENSILNEFAKQGVPAQKGRVPGSIQVDFKGDITALKMFKRGAFHIQGEASQLACAALAAAPDETVLDLCAAPGGKSATIAQYMMNKGKLISCDAAANRLSLIESAMERLGITCAQILHNDGAVFKQELEGADAVLCDVPCSGLGILAKKPDIRQKTLDDLDSLTDLQRKILETASKYVKRGGRLVYSTCTLNPDENEGVVLPFLAEHPEFSVSEVPDLICSPNPKTGFVTLWPQLTGTDGFFIALLKRS